MSYVHHLKKSQLHACTVMHQSEDMAKARVDGSGFCTGGLFGGGSPKLITEAAHNNNTHCAEL